MLNELRQKVPGADLVFLKIDLADLSSVKAAAEEYTG